LRLVNSDPAVAPPSSRSASQKSLTLLNELRDVNPLVAQTVDQLISALHARDVERQPSVKLMAVLTRVARPKAAKMRK
jgi:hypothetical protein